MIWLLWVIWSRRLLFGKTLLCHFFPPDTICCLFFGLHIIAEHYVQQPIPTLALPFILCLNRCHICYHWCLHMEGCRGVVCSPLLSMSACEKVERSPELSHNIKHELLQRVFFLLLISDMKKTDASSADKQHKHKRFYSAYRSLQLKELFSPMITLLSPVRWQTFAHKHFVSL